MSLVLRDSRLRSVVGSAALAWALALLACSSTHGASENSQTHWLRQCTGDAECGALSCVCGVCSADCAEDDACADVGEGAVCRAAVEVADADRCASPAAASARLCTSECVRDADCESLAAGLACTRGVCTAVANTSTQDAGMQGDAAIDDASVADAATRDAGAIVADGGDAAVEFPIAGALRCTDEGVPLALPAGVESVAQDVDGWLWSISSGLVTWIEQPATMEPSTLRRVAVTGGTPRDIELPGGDSYSGLASDGGNAFTRSGRLSDNPVVTYVRRVPESGMPVNLAMEPTDAANEDLVVDDDAVYWVARSSSTEAALVRVLRTPGPSMQLGTLPLTGTKQGVVGPVLNGDFVYLARNEAATSRVMRAPTDGSGALEPLGPELPTVGGMIADGADLLLMLAPELDALDNPIMSARIARMTPDGELRTIIEVEGTSSTLARAGDRLYWSLIENSNADSYHGELWSAPVDGSALPELRFAAEGAVFGPRVRGEDGALYLTLTCLQVRGDTTFQRNHLLRMGE